MIVVNIQMPICERRGFANCASTSLLGELFLVLLFVHRMSANSHLAIVTLGVFQISFSPARRKVEPLFDGFWRFALTTHVALSPVLLCISSSVRFPLRHDGDSRTPKRVNCRSPDIVWNNAESASSLTRFALDGSRPRGYSQKDSGSKRKIRRACRLHGLPFTLPLYLGGTARRWSLFLHSLAAEVTNHRIKESRVLPRATAPLRITPPLSLEFRWGHVDGLLPLIEMRDHYPRFLGRFARRERSTRESFKRSSPNLHHGERGHYT